MRTVKTEDCGVIEYGAAWDYQRRIFDIVSAGRENTDAGVLLLCEHPHVYTLGRSGDPANMLISEALLKSIDATYFHTDRGGDITYHGYGQLVGYPIMDLSKLGLGLKEYIHLLEESVIATVADFGIASGRLDGATGVWIDSSRKICAIGVRASRFVTMHGFALNVTTDLSYFGHINPCGFVDKGVTSIVAEIGGTVEMETVKEVYIRHFARIFGVNTVAAD